MYTILILLIYLAFISLGLPDTLLGSSWPILHKEIGAPISYMGIISMVISFCTIISSLFSDKLTRRFGTRDITTISVFLTAIALLGFSFSSSLTMLLIFSIPYGLGAGAIDAALNNYVAIHYSSKHMSWLHCFWGVGTIISPFVMSYALTHSTWHTGYRIVSFIQLGIGIVLLLTLPIWNANKPQKEREDSSQKSLSIKSALQIKGVPSLLLGFFGYCATESTAMAWACTYLVEIKGIDEPTAAAFASLFFIGLTLGRFLGGFVMDKLGDQRMISLGACIIIIGVALMLIPSDSYIVSLIGLIVCGFGCAPIYPCIIHSTPNNFGSANSGAIIGIQMASAYLGSTFMAPLFGIIGKCIGFELFPIYVLSFTILMITMITRTFKMTQK